MNRALIVGASTITGLAAVLLLNPDSASELSASSAVAGTDSVTATDTPTPQPSTSSTAQGSTTGDDTSSDSATTSPSSGTSDTASPSDQASATQSAAADSSGATTATGTAVTVRNFGVMQVQITTAGGKITDITAVQVPDWDGKSQMINSYAVPELIASALESQSADVSYVSGATFTSQGFAQSLQSALTKAGLG